MKLLLALVTAVATTLGAGWFDHPQQVLRSTTSGVVIGVRVAKSGKTVRGLGAADFMVRDAGVVQEVHVLDGTQPVDVSLYLDASGSIGDPSQLSNDAAAMLTHLRTGDRAEVVVFARAPLRLVPWTSTPVTVPSVPARFFERDMAVTRVYDAIAAALMQPGSPGRRHVVVVLTDGGEQRSVVSLPQLGEIAMRSDAALFLVLVAPAADTAAHAAPGFFNRMHTKLNGVASLAGGAVMSAKKAVDSFRDLLAQLDEQYVLGYTPEGVPAGGWHEIKVELKNPKGATVTARRGYFGG